MNSSNNTAPPASIPAVNLLCPCGSGLPFESCCGPYLAGKSSPPTAETLMRSRYSAFVRHDWDYLNHTQREPDNEPATADIEWLGLEVWEVRAGGVNDAEGTVEFVAHYTHQGRPSALHEISRFSKHDEKWFYVGGEFPRAARPAKVGRNEPCPCGSGKKFKKCCERA
ncbi:MAG: YchJ family metal-binding protein [Sulfuricella sp.]